ncbi:MAG TPA: right-handed parallel beta-helix repeat-containing protein [Methanospirillum sp.]|uniref:NosD domain-containing protein n=1 Tax=Methanospirillum sp. TaxID=45200 RepID=UPI002B82351A|nr:right-handed parallel beta-helix repeat-containing protein [Methanospirillum sp.]HWQ64600.1 right-handed parallel beta-helix repeat-containing protein [Methanospirillum sp.]
MCPSFYVAADTSGVEFPPVIGPYSGDYVYITEPGRYTLEQNISHQYPVGIIIAAPSVILDGQGYSIRPASTESPSVGIWISLTNSAGKPVTGVTIKNVSVEDEGNGIYSEGIDSSLFPWGKDRTSDIDAEKAAEGTQNLILSGVTIKSSHEGITLSNQSDTKITTITIEDCTGSGVTVLGSRADIQDSHIKNNLEYGIIFSKSTGSNITSSVIEGNGKAGISLEGVNGIQIVNNQFHNTQNIEKDAQSRDVVISPPLETGRQDTSIVSREKELWNRSGILSLDQGKTTNTVDKSSNKSQGQLKPEIFGLSPEPSPTVIPTIIPVVTISPNMTPTQDTTPKTTMTGIHAVISGDSIPKEMKAGNTYPVGLILFNDGSDDWISQYQVGIMALEDTAVLGPSWIGIPDGTQIKSGQSQTLSFDIRAPSKPGTYTLKYQAARQGTGVEVLFGRAYTKTVTVV